MPEHFKEETGLTRRTIMRTAAWSVPVIAAAVATPTAAASEFAVVIDGMANTESVGRGNLRVTYINFDAELAVRGYLTWTPSDREYSEQRTFTPRSSGNSLLLRSFIPEVPYIFTVMITGGTSTVSTSFPYTFAPG